MYKTLCVLLLASIAIQANLIKLPSVGGILDEAKRELEELRQIVVGSTASADVTIEDLNNTIILNGNNVLSDGEVAIQTAHEKIIEELDSLIELANTAEVNISKCLTNQKFLNDLPKVIGRQMAFCVVGHVREADRLLQSSKYIIDKTISRVDDLDYQLGLCTEDSILCISPIVRQIGVELVQLPESIKTEELRARQLISTLEVSIQDCSETKVAQFSNDANSILTEISECINKLLK